MPARPQTLAASWSSYDHGALREYFQQLREIGAQHARFDLRWAEAQPGIQRISVTALNGFHRGLDLAQDNGLQVVVSLMGVTFGSVLHLPDWAVGIPAQALSAQGLVTALSAPSLTILDQRHYRRDTVRNLCTDPELRDAQRYLLREVVGNFASHPAIIGWLLGAGIERLGLLDHHRDYAAWWSDLAERARAYGARRLFGQVDATTLSRPDSLRPYDIAMAGGETVVSVGPWPPIGNGPPARGQAACFLHALVAGLLAEEVNDAAAAQVVVADLGWPTAPTPALQGWQTDEVFAQPAQTFLAGEDEAATALQNAISALARQQAAAIWLAGFVDASEPQWRIPPFDRGWIARAWGLWRADGQPKESWIALREAIRALPAQGALPSLPVDPDRFWRHPASELRRLWQEYQRSV